MKPLNHGDDQRPTEYRPGRWAMDTPADSHRENGYIERNLVKSRELGGGPADDNLGSWQTSVTSGVRRRVPSRLREPQAHRWALHGIGIDGQQGKARLPIQWTGPMLFLRARSEPLRHLVSPRAKGDNKATERREGS